MVTLNSVTHESSLESNFLGTVGHSLTENQEPSCFCCSFAIVHQTMLIDRRKRLNQFSYRINIILMVLNVEDGVIR